MIIYLSSKYSLFLTQQFRDQQRSKKSQESDIIPEIKHLVDPEVYNLPEHTVTIADFGEIDFVGNTGLRLGRNTSQVGSLLLYDHMMDMIDFIHRLLSV